jgi:hypothetical protein
MDADEFERRRMTKQRAFLVNAQSNATTTPVLAVAVPNGRVIVAPPEEAAPRLPEGTPPICSFLKVVSETWIWATIFSYD